MLNDTMYESFELLHFMQPSMQYFQGEIWYFLFHLFEAVVIGYLKRYN